MSTIEPHADKLKYIFDNAKVGIAICNAEDNRLEIVNPAFAAIHGYEPHELIGASPGEVFAPECMLRLEAHESAPSCAINDVTFETTHIRKDGSLVNVAVHITVIKDETGVVKQRIANILDITGRKRIEKEIEFLAHHDQLTELPNRILVKEKLKESIQYAQQSDTKTALIFIDLDGFKTINDCLGHSAGDAMLKSVATRLQNSIRTTDTLSRHGGDEFILILQDIREDLDVITIANKLIQQFDDPFHIHDHPLAMSASIGIALYPNHGNTFESLLQCADTAMYHAKESGKNTFRLYTDRMKQNHIEQLTLQNDLKSALAEGQFILHYQPQIDLKTNRIIGAEALIRWKHPTLGMIPPMSFIPVAENSGLIVQIGQWVIEEACRQATHWHSMGITISIAVNISAIQFKRGNLEEIVDNALYISRLEPHYLELELTESIMMHNVEKTLQAVQALKALGVQLSIDDFGTGYSSLAYLKRFAVDKLKIDQSFVRDILKDQEDAVIVNTIIQMAKSLNLKTIAEGVEDAEVLSVIENYGCDEVQGYHFARPMDAGDFERYCANFTTQEVN